MLDGVDPAWWWLIGAAVLIVVELALPGVFLVWIAVAAVLTGVAALATGIALPAQLMVFGLASVAAVLAGRQFYARMAPEETAPMLNDRGARLVGRTVTVSVPIVHGEGRVLIDDGVWTARGPDVSAGVRVRIVGTQGSSVLVDLIE